MEEPPRADTAPRLGVFGPASRLLSFRLTAEDFARLDARHLAFGLAATWIAGMGRYWDHPDANWAQHLGLGSLVYVFALALFLWLVVMPMRPRHWSYRGVLTFVTLTSPPAILYAIPVERFTDLALAQSINFWFLAVVALWRVALLLWFLRRVAGLSWWIVIVSSLLPLALIVVALAALNLEHVVFQIMAGVHGKDEGPHDLAYAVVFMLALLAWFASPVQLLAYVIAVVLRRREGDAPSSNEAAESTDSR